MRRCYSPRNVARDYEEDFAAAVDMNVVMTGSGRFVEVQGTGEEATFSEEELSAMLDLARGGTGDLTALQEEKAAGAGVVLVGWDRKVSTFQPWLSTLGKRLRMEAPRSCRSHAG